jgi:hypothetical protein
LAVLRRLDAARIRYRLEQTRDDAIAIEVVVPGERWEIEFLENGEVEIEIFQEQRRNPRRGRTRRSLRALFGLTPAPRSAFGRWTYIGTSETGQFRTHAGQAERPFVAVVKPLVLNLW